MKKNKDRFKRIKGNNRFYKSIKAEIDPLTDERNIKIDDIAPIDRDALQKGMNNRRKK